MAEQDRLQFFVGRATEDSGWKKKKNGELITKKDGAKIATVRIAMNYGYGDDAEREFISVDVLNEALGESLAGEQKILKGEGVAVVGVRRDGGQYPDTITGFQVGKINWVTKQAASRDF